MFKKFRTILKKIGWNVFEIPETFEQEQFIFNVFTGEDAIPNEYRLLNYQYKRTVYEESVLTPFIEPRKVEKQKIRKTS
jgi:hypothetical protein